MGKENMEWSTDKSNGAFERQTQSHYVGIEIRFVSNSDTFYVKVNRASGWLLFIYSSRY